MRVQYIKLVYVPDRRYYQIVKRCIHFIIIKHLFLEEKILDKTQSKIYLIYKSIADNQNY